MHALCSPGTAAPPLCSNTHDSRGQSQRLRWNDLVDPQAAKDGCSTNNDPASATAGNRMHLVSGRHRKSQQGPSPRVKLWSGSLPLALPTVATQDCSRSNSCAWQSSPHGLFCTRVEQSKLGRLHAPRPAQRSTAHVRVCKRGTGCNQRLCRTALNAARRGNMGAATDANCARHRHATMGGQCRPARQHSMHALHCKQQACGLCSQGAVHEQIPHKCGSTIRCTATTAARGLTCHTTSARCCSQG
jgi:hypothetical protein